MMILKHIGKLAGHFPGIVLRLRCLKRLGRWPDFDQPNNLFEQMMSLALANGHNPLWSTVADKIEVHRYVAETIGDEFVNTIYGQWENPDDIDFESLPERFVLKTNNGCGTNFIVSDKSSLDIDKARKTLKKWLAFPYGELTGQLHYTGIKPQVLAEEFLENTHADESFSLIDYKFLCFHGTPVCIYIYYNRQANSHMPWSKLYDPQGKLMTQYMLPADIERPDVKLPVSFDKMLEAAKILAKPFPLARIDFYDIAGRPVLGEISLTPGLELLKPEFLTDMQELYKSLS